MIGDQYRVETIDKKTVAVVRYGNDGRVVVGMDQNRVLANRMRDELERADERAFKTGLIVGHSEPKPR